jgi:hypothetical protein
LKLSNSLINHNENIVTDQFKLFLLIQKFNRKKSKFKSGIFSPECGTIEDNLHSSRPIVFHNQTVVSRRTTIPGASVGPDRVVEPPRDQAGGLQIVLEVGVQPGIEIRLADQLLAPLAAEDQLVSVFGVLAGVGPVVSHQQRFWNLRQRARSGASKVVDVGAVDAGGGAGRVDGSVQLGVDVQAKVGL